ncbi:2-C-methyl-D-erythritol 4-phosphate cytidylyltransferase [Ningiella sp. W23]|uniref:2-C-methyl-D-erythritol 4-phosphate cytidylyltransferase n=1 Tax=Ningiella sp. W23 TaxID=3023715 RepID=UPI003757C8F0
MTQTYTVIIPAAGSGSRMKVATPKQYLTIHNKTLIEHSICAFLNRSDIELIVVCLQPEDSYFRSLSVSKHAKIATVTGGDTRAKSVLNGLSYILDNARSDMTLVHDAARPGISQAAINRLLSGIQLHSASCEASGAILALPVVDTIKRASNKPFKSEQKDALSNTRYIDTTVDRSHLFQAQTPQAFSAKKLFEALNHSLESGQTITDEASAMEQAGELVQIIEGESRNVKVTRPEDLALAEFYLQQKQGKHD